MKLYSLDDGPLSLACRIVLKALNLEWKNIPLDYNSGEHLAGEYAKVSDKKKYCILHIFFWR